MLHSVIWYYLSLLPIISYSQNWIITDIDEGIKPVIDLDTNGVPHIAYMDESFSGWVRHAVLADSMWNISTGPPKATQKPMAKRKPGSTSCGG